MTGDLTHLNAETADVMADPLASRLQRRHARLQESDWWFRQMAEPLTEAVEQTKQVGVSTGRPLKT